MQLAAWAVHVYTASGAVMALLALLAAVDLRWRDAFLWLALQAFVDSTDGVLARLVDVKARTPRLDGTRLDDLVDYLTYVVVPAFVVVRAGLVPEGWAIPVAAAMLVSSGLGFSNADAKTVDHFFTGFPSYWNVVVLYLVLFGWPGPINAAILIGLAILVFVPIKYVYPSRTPILQGLTIALGAVWAAVMLVCLWRIDEPPRSLVWMSLAFPAYYVALSLWIARRR